MNAPTIAVIAIVAGLVAAALWYMHRAKKKGGACSGCCASCTACIHQQEENR